METQELRHENLPVSCHRHALALHDSVAQDYIFSGAQHYIFSGCDVSRAWTRWLIGLFASPIGVVVLAALDSTPFFSFPFGIDAVVIILAARMGALAWIVPRLDGEICTRCTARIFIECASQPGGERAAGAPQSMSAPN